MPVEVVSWWAQHQKEDALKLARIQEANAKEQLRIDALKKLTKAERKALGL